MYYLKNKYFSRWARKEGVTDQMLRDAIKQFEKGLFEASLGNHLFKKRLALAGRGKSCGVRTILFYQQGKKLIFCYGFSKNQQENIAKDQLALLHKLSDAFQKMSDEVIKEIIQKQALINIAETED